MKRLAIAAFALSAFTFCASFADGLRCTRNAWLLIGPIELLYVPAFMLLGVAVIAGAVTRVRSARRHTPAPPAGIRWQVATAVLLGALWFTPLDPRLYGLALRAKLNEPVLLDFAAKYRAGGEAAVTNQPVMSWSPHFNAYASETPEYVELAWGSALPRSWGFRIDDTKHPARRANRATDASAMAATPRITAFIGVY